MTTHFPIFGAPLAMSSSSRPFLTGLRSAAYLAFFMFPWLTIHGQQIRFDVWKGNSVVGSILAKRTSAGERTQYLMTSYSEFDLVMKQVVRSTVATEYRHGHLSTCHSLVTVNGNLRDSSHYAPGEEEATCYVHPDERFLHAGPVSWTTARMYYEEPIGQRTIFVESVLKPCALKNVGPGLYKLTLPGGKVNTYTYVAGRLEEIHVDRSFFDLVFKRAD